jgi:TRAF2 and NCK interacting kinase
MHTHIDEIH